MYIVFLYLFTEVGLGSFWNSGYDSLLKTTFPSSMATFLMESLGYMYLLSFVHQWETLGFGLQYIACTLLSKIQEAYR